MTAIEGAAKLTAMVIGLERERDEALAELAQRNEPCVWRLEYGGWITGGCSNRPMVYASGFAFCPYCGHRIEVTP